MMGQVLAHEADNCGVGTHSGMMGWGSMMSSVGAGDGFVWTAMILSWLTWILIIAVLVAAIRWLWKKGGK